MKVKLLAKQASNFFISLQPLLFAFSFKVILVDVKWYHCCLNFFFLMSNNVDTVLSAY